MHNQRIDIGSRYLGAVAIATERLLDLGAVYSMTLKESIQLGVVLLGIDRMPISFVVTQEEFRHILAVSYKESNQLMVSYTYITSILHTIGTVEDSPDVIAGGAIVAIELVQATQVNLQGWNEG